MGYLQVSSCLNWRKKSSLISGSDGLSPASIDMFDA